MKNVRIVFALILGLMALSLVAEATIVQEMSVATLTRAADRIVKGEVQSQHTWVDPQNGRPYTYTVIEPQTTYKGQDKQPLRIRQIGGTVNGKTLWVAGTPRFDVGEQVVVFVRQIDDHAVLRGMGQGAFHLEAQADGLVAVQKFESMQVAQKSNDGGFQVGHAEPLRLTLSQLESEIRAALMITTGEED